MTLDGTLDVRKIGFRGTWRGNGQRRALNVFNKPPGRNGIALFTSDWGPATPRVAGSFAVVALAVPARGAERRHRRPPSPAPSRNARVGIPAGSAVLVARGTAATRLQAEALVGDDRHPAAHPHSRTGRRSPTRSAAGPCSSASGKPVFRANEAFSTSQLAPRGPRTASRAARGRQHPLRRDRRAAARLLGRDDELRARADARRGSAPCAGWRSTAAAPRRSRSRARSSTARRTGASGRSRTRSCSSTTASIAPPPAEAVVSPNGDGVAETQTLVVQGRPPVRRHRDADRAGRRRSRSRRRSPREPGTYEVAFPPPAPPPPSTEAAASAARRAAAAGRGPLDARPSPRPTTRASRRRRSGASRVNSTLGFLRVRRLASVFRAERRRAATIRWKQTRPARVKVTVETLERRPHPRPSPSGGSRPGEQSVTWNGRAGEREARGGRPLRRLGSRPRTARGRSSLEPELTRPPRRGARR